MRLKTASCFLFWRESLQIASELLGHLFSHCPIAFSFSLVCKSLQITEQGVGCLHQFLDPWGGGGNRSFRQQLCLVRYKILFHKEKREGLGHWDVLLYPLRGSLVNSALLGWGGGVICFMNVVGVQIINMPFNLGLSILLFFKKLYLILSPNSIQWLCFTRSVHTGVFHADFPVAIPCPVAGLHMLANPGKGVSPG